MKLNFLRSCLFLLVCSSTYSCSSDSSTPPVAADSAKVVTNYTYSAIEIETMDLINSYRVSKGLNPLQKNNYISIKSEEHDNYMISNNVVNHDDFVARSQNIMNVVGAKSVAENIAFNYNTAKAALDAWLASPGHKANIEGNFTNFGISIRTNPVTGAKYYTNIFVKI